LKEGALAPDAEGEAMNRVIAVFFDDGGPPRPEGGEKYK
jgi:hypothetical protein